MDSVVFNQNGDSVEHIISTDHLVSLDSSVTYNVFGDPEVLPRIGDQYQIEIPPLTTKLQYLLCTKTPIDMENKSIFPCDFLMGLPIPIMWIGKKIENLNYEKPEFSEFESVKEDHTFLKDEDLNLKVEPFDVGPSYCLVPGSGGDSWSEIEKDSFVLGLYIFERNFVQVKRFVESKKMEDILAFYYGKFYRSNEYQKWSACRKSRSRKCVYGQRMFIGQRQQQLLSHILPHVSEECRNVLVEVSKTFGEGKMSLEEYVSSVKSMVGMNILVEAVGIGKGKQDLISLTLDPSKSNQIFTTRPEIPIGKACSSLTHKEIIKFLTGDYRLSKARSNDLFWEAVWPLLLAQGWHSEEPAGPGIYAAGLKHSLVFLVPGVKKFSRRRLLKGTHYFDSVTDVLSKVASEPELLEFDKNEGSDVKEESEWANETKPEPERDDLVEPRRHCYLQPRTLCRDTDVMEFTVVDTSLVCGKTCKVRELRSLPLDISKSRSGEDNDRDDMEVSTDKSDCANTVVIDQVEISHTKHMVEMNGPDLTDATLKILKNHKNGRPKQNHLDCSSLPVKRHRKLSACTNADTNHNVTSFSSTKRETNGFFSDAIVLTQIGSLDDKFPSTGSSRGIPIETNHEKPHPAEPLFDLNLPPIPQVDEPFDFLKESSNEHKPCKASAAEPEPWPELNGNYRRQSTRNRPPTARALEALANGLLTTNRRRKSNKPNYTIRAPRRARTAVGGTEFSNGNASTTLREDTCSTGGNIKILGKFMVLSEGNGTHV